MTAGHTPTASITALYNNTTPGTTADPAALDNAIADIVQTIDDNYDFAAGLIGAGTLSRLGIINVKDYHASGSAQTFTGSISAGSRTLVLTTSSHDFVAGHGISIPGAGVAGTALFTTVSTADGAAITIATAASTSTTGAIIRHNDTDAFQSASTAINAQCGGKLTIPPGTYIVGKQTFAGETGLDYSFLSQDIIAIEDCTYPVIIEGNGAKLLADSSLRFGSFDPVSGAVYNPTMPFTDLDYRADTYIAMISLQNNPQVTVRDLELDGNSSNIVLGGTWGDIGRQCSGSGIRSYGNDSVVLENMHVHHHSLDGVKVEYNDLAETDERTPHTLINIVSEYNARQGLSWTGGMGLYAVSCKFNHSGRGAFSTNPSAGVDIEATNSVCREGLFLDCEMINNVGIGVVADSGDGGYSLFKNCTIWGTTTYSIWPQKPNISFENCNIFGGFVNAYSSDDPLEATRFTHCHIEDKEHPDYGVYRPANLINLASANNVLFDGCIIIANALKSFALQSSSGTTLLKNCEITHKYNGLVNKAITCDIRNVQLDNVRFKENIESPPADGYYINITGNTVTYKDVAIDGPVVKWESWSSGAGGMTGNVGSNFINPVQYLKLHKRSRGSSFYGLTIVGSGIAPPTAGDFTAGDIIINSAATLGGIGYWQCIASGTPGTWTPVQIGALTSIAATPLGAGFIAVSGGQIYMAIDTAGTSDWKQISN